MHPVVLVPSDIIPWADVLFALLCKHPSGRTDEAFYRTLYKYFGHTRWVSEIPIEAFDQHVEEILAAHPGVAEVGSCVAVRDTATGQVFGGKKKRKKKKTPAGEVTFVGPKTSLRGVWRWVRSDVIRHDKNHMYFAVALGLVREDGHLTMMGEDLRRREVWEEALPFLLFLMRLNPGFQGLLDYLSDDYEQEVWEGIVHKMVEDKDIRPDVVRATARWKKEIGGEVPTTPSRRRVFEVVDRKYVHGFVYKKLGSNVTCLWFDWRNQEARLYEKTGAKMAFTYQKSKYLNAIVSETHEAMTRKLKLNAGAKFILRGTFTDSVWFDFIKKQIASLMRNKGRDPLGRTFHGALTEKERAEASVESMWEKQHEDTRELRRGFDTQMARVAAKEAQDALGFGVVREEVLDMIESICGNEEGPPELWRYVFQAGYLDDLSVREIAENAEVDRARVRKMMRALRVKIDGEKEAFSQILYGNSTSSPTSP